MDNNFYSELKALNLASTGTGKHKQQQQRHGLVNVVTEEKIDAFCKKVHKAMMVTAEGYLYTSDIANNIYDDNGIDPYREVIDLGFNSFNAFLHSKHMKKYIEIDSSDGVLSYHAIITKEILAEFGHIQREQRMSFLSMGRRMYPSRRFAETDTLGPQQFLKERMRKREQRSQRTEESQWKTLQESCSTDIQSRLEDEFFEEIGEDEQMGLDQIEWVLDGSDEEGEELIFCEAEEC